MSVIQLMYPIGLTCLELEDSILLGGKKRVLSLLVLIRSKHMAKVSSVRFIRCKKCGHKTRDIFHVCPNCGSNLESVSFPYLTWGMIIILAGIGFFAYQSYIPNIEQTVEQIEHTSKQVVSMVDPATETPTPTLTHTSTLYPDQYPDQYSNRYPDQYSNRYSDTNKNRIVAHFHTATDIYTDTFSNLNSDSNSHARSTF